MSRADRVELYLLRHADAGDPESWRGDDDARPLSDKGRRQAEALGRFLKDTGFRPNAIISSPKVRAQETARIVADRIGIDVSTDGRLGGTVDLAIVEGVLGAAGWPSRPVLVGHDPDFSAVLAMLCEAPHTPLKKGALARIDVERPLGRGVGVLRWLVPPDLLGGSG